MERKYDLIPEAEALALIAERIGGDFQAALEDYMSAARLGDIQILESVFCPPYGVDQKPIPRARWAAACVHKDPRFWPSGQSEGLGVIYWQGAAAIAEAGISREVRRADLDRIWPPKVANAAGSLPVTRLRRSGPKAVKLPRVLALMRLIAPEELDAMKVTEMESRFGLSHAYVIKARKTVQGERTIK